MSAPDDENKPLLLTNPVCPFAEKSHLALLFKNIVFAQKFVPLRDPETQLKIPLGSKPEWLLQVNPRGKVPAMVYNGDNVYESDYVNEFLEVVKPEPALWPADPFMRFQGRIILDTGNTMLKPMFQVLQAPDEETLLEARSDLEQILAFLEDKVVLPFFLGDSVSHVDINLFPFLDRIAAVLPVHSGVTLLSAPVEDSDAPYPRLRAFLAAFRATAAAQRYMADATEQWLAEAGDGGLPDAAGADTAADVVQANYHYILAHSMRHYAAAGAAVPSSVNNNGKPTPLVAAAQQSTSAEGKADE